MKIVEEKFLIKEGEFSKSLAFEEILKDIRQGIALITNPFGSTTFKLKPSKKHDNGVTPIKNNMIAHLGERGWKHEQRFKIVDGMGAGPIDSTFKTDYGIFALEFETGNISSSHRALNKIAVGIIQENIIGGVLIVPVKQFAKHLTDRCGNYEEIQAYFPLYQKVEIKEGVLAIISVTYDELDENVPFIPKGEDGNAKKARKK